MENHICKNGHYHAPLSNKIEDFCPKCNNIHNHPYGLRFESNDDGAWKGGWTDCDVWLKMKEQDTWWKE